jgi:hypothetical protein
LESINLRLLFQFTSLPKNNRAFHNQWHLALDLSNINIGQPKLCLIFNNQKMKKIILLSMYIIGSVVLSSCTSDEVDSTFKNDVKMGNNDPNIPIPPPLPN